MALFGKVATVRAQSPQTPVFTEAWAYVQELLSPESAIHQRLARLEAGASEKHELPHGVFAIEQAYETKPRAQGFFESHRKYIDIQVVVTGSEIMEVVDRSRAAVRDPFDGARDLITYTDMTSASILRVEAGEAAIFFPDDVHMPTLRSGTAPVLVRKSVLKLPVMDAGAPSR